MRDLAYASPRELAVEVMSALTAGGIVAVAHDYRADAGPHVEIITGPDTSVCLVIAEGECAHHA